MTRKETKKSRSPSSPKKNENKNGPEKIVLAIFMGVTVLMWVITIIAAALNMGVLFNQKSAEGRVVELTVRYDDQGNNAYYPVVRFVTANGTSKTVQMSEGSWPSAYNIDEKVTVLYNPQQPSQAHIQTDSATMAMWILPLITGGLAVAFLLATFLVRWLLKSDADSAELKKDEANFS
jgi:hypothetical protein